MAKFTEEPSKEAVAFVNMNSHSHNVTLWFPPNPSKAAGNLCLKGNNKQIKESFNEFWNNRILSGAFINQAGVLNMGSNLASTPLTTPCSPFSNGSDQL